MNKNDVLQSRNGRWPHPGDKLISPGDTPLVANVDERTYRLCKGYKVAGDRLVQDAIEDVTEYKNLVYPIVFCYRHYVELVLKSIIEEHGPFVGVTLDEKKDHDLRSLWKRFMRLAESYGVADGEGTPIVASCVDELASIDPASFSFRYARTHKGVPVTLPEDGIDLVVLRDVMNGIETFFECSDLEFSHQQDLVSDAYFSQIGML